MTDMHFDLAASETTTLPAAPRQDSNKAPLYPHTI